MSGGGLAFCSIDEAWGGKVKPSTLDESFNAKTPKSENTNIKKLVSNPGEIDRYNEDHNGPLRKASGPSAANASIRGYKPMEYGPQQQTMDVNNLNPFFKQIVEEYKKENDSLKAQINELRKEINNIRPRDNDASSVQSVRRSISTPSPSSPRPVRSHRPIRKKVRAKEETVNMSHIPFDIEPEVFNVFIFSFFAIMFLLFIDKTLSTKGIRIF